MTLRPSSLSGAVPDDVVATVAGHPISSDRVDGRLADLRRGPRARHIPPDGVGGSATVRRWVVQELVTEAVLAHEARAVGIADVAEADRLSPAEVASLVAHVTAEVAVPEAEARAYYERNRDLYARPERRRVRLVLLRDDADDDPDATAEVREVRRGELVGPFEDAIFGADAGTVVGPLQTEHGWHLAQVEAITPDSVIPFADVRAAIEDDLLVAARARAFDEWLDRRRRDLVAIEPGFEHPGHPVHGVPSHRH